MVEYINKFFSWGRCTVLFGALLVLFSFANCYPQTSSGINNPFNNAFVFGLDGGITIPQTDYKQSKTGFSFRGVGEYFFNTNSIHLVGLKLKLASEQIKGEDDRGIISSQDGQRNIPLTFTTNIFSVGLAATYSLSIGDFFFPYISAGVSNLWFDPKDDQDKPAEFNAANKYSKTTYAFNFEFGLKFLVSDKVSINVAVNPYLPGTDYLDDVSAAFNKDTYSSVLIGFSYSPFFENDTDNDGIKGSDDLCPDKPEDFDGFEDADGCPDLDNDADGILDVNDKCPNEAEDFDGFEDADGCPDLDNDADGILDVNDKCPNEAEDFDGFEDEDGCPEAKSELIKEDKFNLIADEIFSPNSAMIKVEGKKYLDQVISQLQQFPDKSWRIEGHMDSNGSKRFLRNLSLDRAKAVLEYFTFFGGLKRENFQVFGMGGNFPIDSNDTEEGRARNRRIEIIPEE